MMVKYIIVPNKFLSLMLILILGFCSTVGWAVVNPRPMAGDSRIKIINYTPNAVFRYQGCYYYQSIIEFSLK